MAIRHIPISTKFQMDHPSAGKPTLFEGTGNERKPGYYWTQNHNGTWAISEYLGDEWWLCGNLTMPTEIIKAIDETPITRQASKPEQEWISVKDGFPDESIYEVLVKVDEPFWTTTTERMIVAYYSHELERWCCELTSKDVHHVTHWMPLPAAPRKEQSADDKEMKI